MAKTYTALITRDLAHMSSTCETYKSADDDNPSMYGYALSKLVDGLLLAHGTVLRVTVEVIDPGTPCPVREWKDVGCTRTEES